ncbi:hypothetical protein, partial [Martelella lutilitoris]|uniref:hypothetical protein n=1 Tax=Martelella lutilitoris TaxID=2583532 RepID=UPI0016510C0B
RTYRKTRFLSGTALAVFLASGAAGLVAPDMARAETLYWNTGPGGTGLPDGSVSGTWSTSALNWTTLSISPNRSWPNTTPGDVAAFQLIDFVTSAQIEVTIDEDLTVGGIIIGGNSQTNPGGYQNLLFAGSGSIAMSPTAGQNFTISSTQSDRIYFNTIIMDGTVSDLHITGGGGGAVTVIGDQQYTGTTYIDNASKFRLGGITSQSGNNPENKPATVVGDIVVGAGSHFQVAAYEQDYQFTRNNVTSVDRSGYFDIYMGGGTRDNIGNILTQGYAVFLDKDLSTSFTGTLVNNGILDGTGAVGGNVTISNGGAILRGTQGTTRLGLGTSVTFQAGRPAGAYFLNPSNLNVTLNQANALRTMFSTGDLDTRGGLLTVTGPGGGPDAEAGVYNILQYTGNLQQDPTNIFSAAPTINGFSGNYRLDIVTPGVRGEEPGMLRIVAYDSNNEVAQYWNGAALPADDGTLIGGSGSWTTASNKWSTINGEGNAAWAGSVGIFAGQNGGQVTVG